VEISQKLQFGKVKVLGKSRDDFSFLENNKKLQILFSEVFCA